MANRENSSTKLASPWRFRDGNEYLVSLSINEKPKWISVLLSDKITAEEWSGQFDLKYIEILTQRTGNYKPFDTFLAMLKSAILKKSDSVTLDLMSYDDLLTLKNLKSRLGPTASTELNLGPNLAKFDDNNSDPERLQTNNNNKRTSRYLIITYVAEFDKVHYPLPLKYTGFPDATVMQQTIQKLRSEVQQLKMANTDLIVQLQSGLKSDSRRKYGRALKVTDSSELDSTGGGTDSETDFPTRRDSRRDISQEKFQSLAKMVKDLESRMEEERLGHKDQMVRLEAENEFLRNKLKGMETAESILKDKVTRLESVLALNVGLKKGSHQSVQPRNASKDREINPQASYLLRSSSFTRTSRPKNRTRAMPVPRNTSNSSNKCSSVDRERDEGGNEALLGSCLNDCVSHRASGSRRSSSERRPFDPTEYVKQKKMKQERMAQLRMAKVESRIQSKNRDAQFHPQDTVIRLGKTDNGRPTRGSVTRLRSPGLGEKNRNLRRNSSNDSQISIQSDRPYSVGRRISPSPTRKSSYTHTPATTTLRYLHKHRNPNAPVPKQSSFERLQSRKDKHFGNEGVRDSGSRGHLDTMNKSSKKNLNPPKRADSSLSFDKLQKRLHTIHAFLEMNKRRRT